MRTRQNLFDGKLGTSGNLNQASFFAVAEFLLADPPRSCLSTVLRFVLANLHPSTNTRVCAHKSKSSMLILMNIPIDFGSGQLSRLGAFGPAVATHTRVLLPLLHLDRLT